MEERLGRYQLVRRLGDNDLCDAYTALQHGDGGFVREVLVKRLKDALTTETSALRAFQGEALLLARLRQRSIPHVYDLQRDPKSGAWFIALEFIPGPTLKWVMETERERRTPLPMALALSVVSQLCAAVHHMHELTNTYGQPSELVHRNLAPENVVLGRDGLARLMDFGCAVPRSDLDATGSDGRGAAGYMAPEQILGSEPPDRRADVFVLGVLLYEMTTGVRLYDGRGERLRRALMDVDAPPASTRRSGFPAVLDEILAGRLGARSQLAPRHRRRVAAADRRVRGGAAHPAGHRARGRVPGRSVSPGLGAREGRVARVPGAGRPCQRAARAEDVAAAGPLQQLCATTASELVASCGTVHRPRRPGAGCGGRAQRRERVRGRGHHGGAEPGANRRLAPPIARASAAEHRRVPARGRHHRGRQEEALTHARQGSWLSAEALAAQASSATSFCFHSE
jgi:tRNA A-37 threonylcarbamoyl transferase component Bud32